METPANLAMSFILVILGGITVI
jgi:hypothetical protein